MTPEERRIHALRKLLGEGQPGVWLAPNLSLIDLKNMIAFAAQDPDELERMKKIHAEMKGHAE